MNDWSARDIQAQQLGVGLRSPKDLRVGRFVARHVLFLSLLYQYW